MDMSLINEIASKIYSIILPVCSDCCQMHPEFVPLQSPKFDTLRKLDELIFLTNIASSLNI